LYVSGQTTGGGAGEAQWPPVRESSWLFNGLSPKEHSRATKLPRQNVFFSKKHLLLLLLFTIGLNKRHRLAIHEKFG